MSDERVYQPRDPAPLAQAVVGWLYADIAINLISAAAAAYEISILSRLDPAAPAGLFEPFSGAEVSDLVRAIIGLALLITILVVGVLSLKWIYLTKLNARVLARGLRFSPAWSVGWFFVPIATLWLPFQAVRETWQASARPRAWRSAPVPGLLRWWWGLWLVSSFLGNISLRLSFGADTIEGLIVSDAVEIVGEFLSLPLDLVFIRIVQGITAMQVEALALRAHEHGRAALAAEEVADRVPNPASSAHEDGAPHSPHG